MSVNFIIKINKKVGLRLIHIGLLAFVPFGIQRAKATMDVDHIAPHTKEEPNHQVFFEDQKPKNLSKVKLRNAMYEEIVKHIAERFENAYKNAFKKRMAKGLLKQFDKNTQKKFMQLATKLFMNEIKAELLLQKKNMQEAIDSFFTETNPQELDEKTLKKHKAVIEAKFGVAVGKAFLTSRYKSFGSKAIKSLSGFFLKYYLLFFMKALGIVFGFAYALLFCVEVFDTAHQKKVKLEEKLAIAYFIGGDKFAYSHFPSFAYTNAYLAKKKEGHIYAEVYAPIYSEKYNRAYDQYVTPAVHQVNLIVSTPNMPPFIPSGHDHRIFTAKKMINYIIKPYILPIITKEADDIAKKVQKKIESHYYIKSFANREAWTRAIQEKLTQVIEKIEARCTYNPPPVVNSLRDFFLWPIQKILSYRYRYFIYKATKFYHNEIAKLEARLEKTKEYKKLLASGYIREESKKVNLYIPSELEGMIGTWIL